ncbi:MAG: class III extradiol dioxygenase subunit B-like domain-containing protein [Mycobacteriales bacterium]
MIVAVGACPHPPLLVPCLAAGAAEELAGLRLACTSAVRRLVSADPDVICVVGTGSAERWYDDRASGSFQAYGVPLEVGLGAAPAGPPTLPLSLTVGAWLLHGEEVTGQQMAGGRCGLAVPAGASADDLGRLRQRLDSLAPTVGLLVMGDGSARRSERAPGSLDARSAGFDAAVATALATGDPDALAGLDPVLGAELMAAGTAAWRLLGAAAADATWDAELLADIAPYGVGYLVASWTRRG